MAHFLTPAKLGLLCLAKLYAEGSCPKSSAVPVLSLLLTNLLPMEQTLKCSGQVDVRRLSLVSQAEEKLRDVASQHAGQSIYDVFLAELWNLRCLDSLEEFIDRMLLFVQKSRDELLVDRDNGQLGTDPQRVYGRTSPIGTLIRKCHLEYSKLQFQEAAELWRGFVQFRRQTLESMSQEQRAARQDALEDDLLLVGAEHAQKLASVVYRDMDSCQPTGIGAGSVDYEGLFEFQVQRMQSHGTRLPEAMRDHFRQLTAARHALPATLIRYVRFLETWKAGDHSSAFDHLHRYFDFAMHKHGRSYYQYALLNLAVLQADFGCYAEAVAAIRETISTARELHDDSCLNFAMSWLYHFSKKYPDEVADVRKTGMLGRDDEALAFLQARAREAESWGLLATAHLSEARLLLQNVRLEVSMSTQAPRLTRSMAKDLDKNPMPRQSLYAAAYDRLGISHLAWLAFDVCDSCYPDAGTADDIAQASYRKVLMLIAQCRHEVALKILEDIPIETLPLKLHRRRRIYEGLVKFDYFLARGDMIRCEHMLDDLRACTQRNPDDNMLVGFQEAQFHIRKGDYDAAMAVVEQCAALMRPETFDVATQVQLLNLKVLIFERLGQPERGFSLAMRAVGIALRARVYPGLWEAAAALANILMALCEFQPAVDILEAIMPHVLAYHNVALRARVASLLADGHMGLAGQARGQAGTDRHVVDAQLEEAIDALDDCLSHLRVLGDGDRQCEMMAKKMLALRVLGDFARTEETAAEYLEARKRMAQQATVA
ncbi:anaphase promoting complex subunit 5 [Ascosphaera acerosa]|nr:anaphase promoting complex subunit 5 [Ascosphaera acerosa]